MDLDLAATAATTTTATTALVNSSQENNQLLLNAIKNKFAAQTAQEAAAFSPPKFNIPLLKIPSNASTENNTNTNCSSSSSSNTPPNTQLNQFLLKQLQEKHANNIKDKESNGFVLPQLQFNNSNNNNKKNALKFELPVLQQNSIDNDSKVSSLTSAINKLQVADLTATERNKLPALTNSANIDLTTALSSKRHTHQQGTPPTRDFAKFSTKSHNEELDFDIPFIDCDRLDNSRKRDVLLPLSNEYCITDISQLLLNHSCVESPSVIGRFLCLTDDKYLPPEPLKCLSRDYHQQPVKHIITPFRFETKSPDDIVLEALNKYQRRHYN